MAFDRLRDEGFFIGEFIWNFADFRTAESKYYPGINFLLLFLRLFFMAKLLLL